MRRVVLALAALGSITEVVGYYSQAWQSLGGNTEKVEWPELEYEAVVAAPNIGFTFSGGGSRAYLASIGFLAAFHELGLMNNVRYIVSVSGGSWASAVYAYYQHSNNTDSEMLGKVVFPSDIVYNDLGVPDEKCVRGYTNNTFKLRGVYFEDWVEAVQEIYFTPAGIGSDSFSYDSTTVASIKDRNPSLEDTEFVLLRQASEGIDTRPFPVISTTLVGPMDMLPATPSNRNYNLLEFTPLSAGVAYSSSVTYNYFNSSDEGETLVVGGMIENYAFGGLTAPEDGLPLESLTGMLDVPDTPILCDLALAAGSSSWAPGCLIAASDKEAVWETAGMLNFSSPSATHPADEFATYAVADGAGVSNTNLISLIQRKVSTIVAFVSTGVSLQNSTHWNPETDPLSVDDIDFCIPPWFGILPTDLTEYNNISYDLVNSQVFASDEWLPFIKDLQAAQAAGTGMVISRNHTTVRNEKYGIEAGRLVYVVWVMLGRATEWESQLSRDMKNRVVPKTDPANQANTIEVGEFKGFPGYMTALAGINIQQGNLLADFAGWTIYQNQDVFKEAFARQIAIDAETTAPTQYPTSNNEKHGSNEDNVDFAESPGGIVMILFIVLVVAVAVILGFRYFSKPKAANQSIDSRQSEMSPNLKTNLI